MQSVNRLTEINISLRSFATPIWQSEWYSDLLKGVELIVSLQSPEEGVVVALLMLADAEHLLYFCGQCVYAGVIVVQQECLADQVHLLQ